MDKHTISTIKIVTWNTEDYFKIIDLLYRIVYPHEFIPMFYPEDSVLYFFKCTSAINKLKEIIGSDSYEYEKGKTFSLTFSTSNSPYILKVVGTESVQSVLYYVIRTLLRDSDTLDLQKFLEDKDLLKTYYFPLFYPPNITVLLKVISTINFDCLKTLNLASNKIRSIADFQIPIWAPNLKNLDISNNKLTSLKDIATLRTLNLKSLKLAGNPLTSEYTKQSYTEVFTLLFPNLHKLDDRNLMVKGTVLAQAKHFTVDSSATKLVDDFLKLYFDIFDSDERLLLQEMYHQTAMFSLSCEYADYVAKFLKWKRNLIEDKKPDGNLFSGPITITKCLQSLPKTQHDPFTFNIDVTKHNQKYTLIHISGVFKIPAANLSQDEVVFEFMRTFQLINENYRYKITNDMLSISSVVTTKSKSAFQKVAVKETVSLDFKTEPQDGQKKILKVLLKNICELNLEQCETCLIKANWNFASAIKEAMKFIDINGFESSETVVLL